MNGHSTTSSYSDRLEAFRQSDAERDALCAEVIRKYEDLQLKYAEVVDDYKNEIESRRLWQSKANTHERALAEHKQTSVDFDQTDCGDCYDVVQNADICRYQTRSCS